MQLNLRYSIKKRLLQIGASPYTPKRCFWQSIGTNRAKVRLIGHGEKQGGEEGIYKKEGGGEEGGTSNQSPGAWPGPTAISCHLNGPFAMKNIPSLTDVGKIAFSPYTFQTCLLYMAGAHTHTHTRSRKNTPSPPNTQTHTQIWAILLAGPHRV